MKTLMLAAAAMVGFGFAAAAPAQTPAPNSPPPPSFELVFKDAACAGKADGAYCGTGSNHQQFYRCRAGRIEEQLGCLGGCDPATLECKQRTGVKAIDNTLKP